MTSLGLSRLSPRLALLGWLWCFAAWGQAPAPDAPRGRLEVVFFDVGQGDAALIKSPTGKTVLIDGGPPEAGRALARRVQRWAPQGLDLAILSHPHLDHLGGMAAVIERVGAKRFIDPGFDHPSTAYEQLLTVVGAKVGSVMVPSTEALAADESLTIGIGDGATLTFFWPRRPREPFLHDTRSDANANSIVFRLSYGNTSVLFTGDSEADTEAVLLKRPQALKSDILKVAHHGSRHSSTSAFLAAVDPAHAVISCASKNDYGHPGTETLIRLSNEGATVHRTDLEGDIRFVSDGRTFEKLAKEGSLAPSPAATASPINLAPPTAAATQSTVPQAPSGEVPGPFVAAKVSRFFHKSDCPAASKLLEKNRVFFRSRDAAAKERQPAEDCHP